MVLEFPIMADYALLDSKKGALFATHGHLFNAENPPLLQAGDALLNGHFHTPCHYKIANGALYVNCCSVALPKDGTPHSYVVFDGETFIWKNLENGEIFDKATI